MDRVSWEPIPEDGLELPAKKAVYLKGTITGPLKESYSQITSDGMMLDYEGPGNGNTAFTLDLKTHDGEAYMEWD